VPGARPLPFRCGKRCDPTSNSAAATWPIALRTPQRRYLWWHDASRSSGLPSLLLHPEPSATIGGLQIVNGAGPRRRHWLRCPLPRQARSTGMWLSDHSSSARRQSHIHAPASRSRLPPPPTHASQRGCRFTTSVRERTNYFSREFVRGQSLTTWSARKESSLQVAVRLHPASARGLQYAHNHGMFPGRQAGKQKKLKKTKKNMMINVQRNSEGRDLARQNARAVPRPKQLRKRLIMPPQLIVLRPCRCPAVVTAQ